MKLRPSCVETLDNVFYNHEMGWEDLRKEKTKVVHGKVPARMPFP